MSKPEAYRMRVFINKSFVLAEGFIGRLASSVDNRTPEQVMTEHFLRGLHASLTEGRARVSNCELQFMYDDSGQWEADRAARV